METTNTYYPVFEPDQVLTSEHLNQLRRFLAAQDRHSRRLLHGIGIVCGLEVRNPASDTIRITKGVGITSMGFLISIEQADCKFVRPYKDKTFIEVNCETQSDGKYDLFLDSNGKQFDLWELLTTEEEAETKDPQIKTLIKAAQSLKMDEMYVLLYLEIEDKNMMACFGDDCDEKGIQRNFTVRKLLINKKDLLKMIKEAASLYEKISEEDLDKEINSRYSLKEVSIKRLGYDFSQKARTLELKEYHDFETLFDNYASVIQPAVLEIGIALHTSYAAYDNLLKSVYGSNPFKNFDSEILSQNPLFQICVNAIKNNRLSIQYIYDFLADLIEAYYEFKDTAIELISVCCPNPNLFPRHLMLGKVIVEIKNKPGIFRNYFIPSPISGNQKGLRERTIFYHKKLVKLVDHFNAAAIDSKEIRITPSPLFSSPLSKRAIPFYYENKEENGMNSFWNYENYKNFRTRMELSYHSDLYNSSDEFITRPSFWHYNQYDFLRVEGHIGKKYEIAAANILSLQKRLNLPVKIVGVKLSRRFDNTAMTVECHFDDLQNLYRTFMTELKCVLSEEADFFRNLETEPKKRSAAAVAETDKSKKVLELLDDKAGTSKTSEKTTSGLKINTTIDIKKDSSKIYQAAKEGTIGFLMDNIDKSSGQTVYNTILNLYAAGNFSYLLPGFFIYTILYPVQIASEIDNLLTNIPDKLEEIDIRLLKKNYDTLVETAGSFKKSILESLANPDYQRIGNEELIIYRLDKLIYHCSIRKLVELYKIYLTRIEEVKKLNLFSKFAENHPGMEHMAGVPKGGTFVIVYVDANEKEEFVPEKETGMVGVREAARTADLSYKIREAVGVSELKSNLSKGFSVGKLSEALVSNENRFTPADEKIPNNIVVADFALPYLSMGNCPEIATMIVSQITFSLEKNTFCSVDQKQYSFITDPKGGRIKGPGVILSGDEFFFVPAEVNQETEDVELFYFINNQTISLKVKVFNPKASFIYEYQEDSRKILFLNKSTGADKFFWDFGDGKTSEERDVIHDFSGFDAPVAKVVLTAKRENCENVASEEVKMIKPSPIIFDIIPKIFCGNDAGTFPFETSPEGGTVSGPGVILQNGTFFFSPSKVDKSIETMTLEYKLSTGDSATLVVTLIHIRADFDFEVFPFDPEIKGVKVIFKNLSEKAEKFNWDFGDGKSSEESDPVHVYTNFDKPEVNVVFKVFNEKCTDTISKKVPISREQGSSKDFNLPLMTSMSGQEVSREIFGIRKALPGLMITYYSGVKKDLDNNDILKDYSLGKKNDEIAKFTSNFNEIIFKAIDRLKADDPDFKQKETFSCRFMTINLENMITLAGLLDNDINRSEELNTAFSNLANMFQQLIKKSIAVDPDGKISKLLEAAVRFFKSKPNLDKAMTDLFDSLK